MTNFSLNISQTDVIPQGASRFHEISFTAAGKIIEFKLHFEPGWRSWTEGAIYEPEVVDVFTKFVKPGDFVIDAGANHGFHSMVLSRLVGAKGQVIALEPGPVACTQLRKNLLLNDAVNVVAIQRALWSANCVKPMCFTPDHGYSSFYHFANDEKYSMTFGDVETQTIDDLLKYASMNPRLIKIDCEGAEEDILRGAEQTLRKGVDCVVAELNFKMLPLFNRSERTMRDFMYGLGYDFFILETQYPPMYIPHKYNVKPIGQAVMCNTMFAKRELVNELWRI